ncbi:MAG: hypothetical protein RLZ48_470 [Actinomycetota bacterium]
MGSRALAPKTTRQNNSISVSVGSLNATFAPLDAKGNPAVLDAEGNIRLKIGDRIKVKMSGFQPGSLVEAWMFSTPVLLGRITVDDRGMIDRDFVIPNSVESGLHRIALTAVSADGKKATIGLGVKIGDWKKENNTAVLFIVIPVALAMLGALLLPAVSRRRRRA